MKIHQSQKDTPAKDKPVEDGQFELSVLDDAQLDDIVGGLRRRPHVVTFDDLLF